MPVVGGSSGSWGQILNDFVLDAVDGLDTVLDTIQTTANNALSRVNGGQMLGEIDTLTQVFTEVALGLMGATPAIDISAADFFSGEVDTDWTSPLDIQNPPAAGNVAFVVLELTNPGSATLNWPASVQWPGGTEPAWTSSGVDVVSLYTRDGGTTWRAARVQADSS